MMKAGSKRRRTHQEKEDEKLLRAQREQEIADKTAAFAQMEARMAEMESKARSNQAASDILNHFVERGLAEVDANGNVSIPDNGMGDVNANSSL